MKFKEPERPTKHLQDFDEESKKRADRSYVDMQKAFWLAAVGLDPANPTGKPVDDGIPLQTRLPPDMVAAGVKVPQNANTATERAAPPAPAPPAAPRPMTTPRIGRGRNNRSR